MKYLALLLLLGCAFPEQKLIRGAIVRIQHRPDYEAACGLFQQIRDKSACDALPFCCAYRVTVRDAEGHEERFYAFWPKYAGGLLGLVALGDTALFTLHRRRVYEFPCTMYGCRFTWEYALDGDEDVRR